MLKKKFIFSNLASEKSTDLGFGSVVTEQSRNRFINRDGSFNVRRKGLNFFSSLSIYHHLLNLSWPKFLIVASLGYFFMNLCFAVSYVLVGATALGLPPEPTFSSRLLKAFFFSVQTSSTIGYGNITPHGTPANFLMTLESFVGLMGIALVTGMVFARFSRPTANIIFSDHALIAPYKEITAFEFRIVNARHNQIIELDAQVHFSCQEMHNNQRKRSFHRLHLERSRVPFFPLSWTVVHPIDEQSPLYQMTHAQLLESNAEFLILLTGLDDTFNQTVHSRSSYKADEIVFGARFTSLYEHLHENDVITINIDKLSEFEKI